MSIHKLYIFAKNRDAIAAQKGYAFQQLKTLEDWIENRVANGDEIIYCDYEDDILARDTVQGKSKFKQVKLYSTDFSFSSESIKRAISHFFMLYVKGDYAFDQTEFSFETNASIIQRTVKENDADLLQEWYENQGKIEYDLLDRIRVRVKKIITEYIDKVIKDLGNNVELKGEIQQAKNIYDNLKNEDFNSFIRCIKWQFEGLESNTAVEQIVTRVEALIFKIPLPLNDQRTQIYVALLVNEVYQRSIQDDPENRKLTKDLLDSILLNAGEKEDKWYVEILQQFKANNKITFFFAGGFQSIINGTRYCRWNLVDDGHKQFWLDLLKQYITLGETPTANKRKAIYEYLFLKIGHNPFEERTESAINDDIELINIYMEQWTHRSNLLDIEDDITLLQLLKAQVVRFSFLISEDQLLSFQKKIQTFLYDEIQKETNVDRLCDLLEMRGHLAQQNDIFNPVESLKAAFEYYQKIAALLDKAHYYSLARLYNQMRAMIKMLIQFGINDGLIEMVDEFMNEIQGYAEKTGLRHKAAHDLIERGILHLENLDVKNYIKALELFHRAKELWRLEYTKEGYILSLLNIAQVYNSLGMSYASKYYALAAFWSTWQFSDSSLYKRLPQALGLIVFSDFSHGAWMNAIEDFDLYLATKREFDEKGFEIYDDEIYQKTIGNIASIVQAAPLIHPELSEFIHSLKARWSIIWDQQIQPLVQHVNERIKDMDSLKAVIARNLRDNPLNDVGLKRNIRFNALNIDWRIQFDNNETMTSIGEEFVSFLQIALCEIARINNQLLNGAKRVSISVQEGHFQKEHLGNDNWVITIPKFESKDEMKIKMHYAYLGSLIKAILINISNLSKEDFENFYIEKLLKKEKFGEKVLEATTYQKAFRSSISTARFEVSKRLSLSGLAENGIAMIYTRYLIDQK